MKIQWFPGHMAKTIRILSENLKLVDIVIELLDARIPYSSKNPDVDKIINNKKKIIALNKCDLADDKISKAWVSYYRNLGYECLLIDSVHGRGINELKTKLREMMKEKIERQKSKGILFTPIRTMVVGVPNVGKSSFINKIAGRATAVTGDRPGVTRSKLWIKINREIELMDTPGILWPKFDDKDVGRNLAFTGAIKDEIMDITELAENLLGFFKLNYPERVEERYKMHSIHEKSSEELLIEAGKNRGCIVSGGEVDLSRIAAIILDEFRGGKLGKITLESPDS